MVCPERKAAKKEKQSLKDKLKDVTIGEIKRGYEFDANLTRMHWLDRWAWISNAPKLENGKYDYSKIDYSNEFVKLEYEMCDVQVLQSLCGSNHDSKYYKEGLEYLKERGIYETFFKTGPDCDRPYCEQKFNAKEVGRVIRSNIKLKRREIKKGLKGVTKDNAEDRLGKLVEEVNKEVESHELQETTDDKCTEETGKGDD